MKKLLIFAVLSFAMCGFVFAQTPRAVLEKVKEIKLLESTRSDVRRILANFDLPESNTERYYDLFWNDIAEVRVSYADGRCKGWWNNEDDVAIIWDVAEWKVTKIEITFDDQHIVHYKDLGFDLASFKKQNIYPNNEKSDYFIYHNKSSGIAFIFGHLVEKVILHPPVTRYSMLCDNQKAEKFFADEKWFGTEEWKSKSLCEPPFQGVEDLRLSAEEITYGCDNNGRDKSAQISVETVAPDTGDGSVTYNYRISVGKIIGEGANVVWDLTGVKPGTYTITAAAIDDSGIGARTETDTVNILECANPAPK